MSFAAASSAMPATALLVGGCLALAACKRAPVPGRLPASGETPCAFVRDAPATAARGTGLRRSQPGKASPAGLMTGSTR